MFQFGSGSAPRAIVVDPSTRYCTVTWILIIHNLRWMYWTDWGSEPRIERASMDGSNRTTLHTTNLRWPNGLTIDYDSQTLYWVDAFLDRLESSRTDGSGRTLLSTRHIYHPFGLTFNQGDLFWSDWQLNAILGAPANNATAVGLVLENLVLDPMGIISSCPNRQPTCEHSQMCKLLPPCNYNVISFPVPNPCDGKCKNFCLLSKSESVGYSCYCCSTNGVTGKGKVFIVYW